MKNEGLYIRLLPGGKIKRRLVTILGEVPLEDTTIAAELITLHDTNNVPMYQAIKDIWAYASYVDRSPRDLREFEEALEAYLHWLRNRNLIRYSLFMTTYEDLDEKPDYSTPEGAIAIARLLTESMAPDHVVAGTLYAISQNQTLALDGEHSYLRESSCIAHYLLEDAVEEEYQFRNEEQYYIFLLQQYILSAPNLIPCQFCGRYFVPKTRKLTKYCDRMIRNSKTCKKVAPGLKKRERDAAHMVTSEFMRIKDMLFHRKDRVGEDKKSSVIDLTDGEYVQWLVAATDARDRYLAGELSEEEAMAIIYVPKKDELLDNISSELTLANSGAES